MDPAAGFALAVGVVLAVAGLGIQVGGFQHKRFGWFMLAICPVPLLVFVASNYDRFFWPSFIGIWALAIAGAWPLARLRQAKTPPIAANLEAEDFPGGAGVRVTNL